MADKKEPSFTVTDKRLFTLDGELRKDAPEESSSESPKPSGSESAKNTAPEPPAEDMPPLPSAAEQKSQQDAYAQSSKDMDSRVELSGGSAKDFEMTFERFMASLYMTAMLQLGLMHEEGGQPHVDLVGGRQTIDTLSLLSEKTKGNLTQREENFLQNCLYELRMAYVEVTNSLTRPPQASGSQSAPRAK
ncbi:MAG TPA: DUF1844 domain-containing protein [Terriglobales bacterium]|nr:DUF1844 domain-containing protein [Terriglobales bacterium]